MRTNPTALLDTKRRTQTNPLETISATRNKNYISISLGEITRRSKEINQRKNKTPEKTEIGEDPRHKEFDGDTETHSSSRKTPRRRIGVTVIDRHTWSSSAFEEASLWNRIDPPTEITETETNTAPDKSQKKDEKSHLSPPRPPFSAARLCFGFHAEWMLRTSSRHFISCPFIFFPPNYLGSHPVFHWHVIRVPQAYSR